MIEIESLQAQLMRYEKVIDALPQFMFVFDENFYIRDVILPKGIKLLHQPSEIIGKHGNEFYAPDVALMFRKNIAECLSIGRQIEMEYPMNIKGAVYYYQARLSVYAQGQVLAIFRDITQSIGQINELSEQVKKTEKANREKTLFLANMSHEIRTPLNAIVGFTELLPMAETPEERDEYIDTIQKSSALLLELINDVLDLSRIEAGKVEMRFSHTSLMQVVNDVVHIHQLKMPQGVVLNMELPERDIVLSTDYHRLMQVLNNFMTNAIKNTYSGSITIGLREVNEEAQLFVTDTGVGMELEQIPLIFERFKKLNECVQGTGLGLPLCKSIVESLGGQIKITSCVGEGSTFSIFLPLVGSLRVGRVYSRKKLMLADSDENGFRQFRELFKNDYDVIWTRSNPEAFTRFQIERPDVILIGLNSEELNALKLVQEIRKLSDKVPIVVVTESQLYDEQKRLQEAGCNDVLSMPVSSRRLMDMITVWVNKC